MELIRPSTGDQLFSEGMNLAVVCQEISGAPQTAIDERGLPISPRLIRFAQDDVAQRLALCALWLGEDVERRPQAVSTSQVPALVLRGERDVIVPASWDARVVQSLPDSFYLSFAQAGHGVVTNNTCARDALAAFLLDPASAPESTCRE
jgi:pimeloyl-ACP methyl ester carboxylesterase